MKLSNQSPSHKTKKKSIIFLSLENIAIHLSSEVIDEVDKHSNMVLYLFIFLITIMTNLLFSVPVLRPPLIYDAWEYNILGSVKFNLRNCDNS